MEPSVVVIGLSRQAVFWGLPLPYFLAVGALIMFPFILFKVLSWLLTAPLWYMAARIVTAINPNIHNVMTVRLRHTPMSLLRFGKA
ncbi:MAG: VirB3 family type IV secretion system protein, partial [Albidovulum sp.]|uniref:VirB3 family type IV secretion system protein n=1 Tax=Albidovulum sp. TaxID=1872424 RepID=UPI003C858A6E